MADQTVCFVLCGDANAANARVEGIRQGKVDDAGFATEEYGGLCTAICQLHQTRATPPSENESHGITGKAAVLVV